MAKVNYRWNLKDYTVELKKDTFYIIVSGRKGVYVEPRTGYTTIIHLQGYNVPVGINRMGKSWGVTELTTGRLITTDDTRIAAIRAVHACENQIAAIYKNREIYQIYINEYQDALNSYNAAREREEKAKKEKEEKERKEKTMRNYFENVETLEDLKKEYHKLVMANHPDRGGDVEIMKEINAQYEKVFAKVKMYHRNKDGETYKKDVDEAPEAFRDLIEKLIKLAGIKIEVIGSWVWVSGNSFPHREALKELGFSWSKRKQVWHKGPAGYRSRGKYNSMDEIRTTFGVDYETETDEKENPKKLK